MPTIRPISDLRNKFHEIAEICHTEDEPVFITRNGEGDLVVMSLAHYERREALLDLYRKLAEAEATAAAGMQGITHEQMMNKLREKINGQA
ncbi:Antitoxin Phd_YefM, type II toxin-antitoxin system [Neomoorella glycerini]|uniref:Antitoxin n=1 Tax=Neomoorella glycerini TaxID=55779 RepID=A0A6I5ZS40_9FIRM|nr:type II toxin-antitoxin system prevent-host-death family antitoxin [Moorella glycerini]QGP92812.1 Antitoxin Phd_YefM, type II toxin-antitoxin system [Moorella glycerini]